MIRITDPRQQGARLSWHDSLFETLPILFESAPEPIPVGEASDTDFGEFLLALREHASPRRSMQPARPAGLCAGGLCAAAHEGSTA